MEADVALVGDACKVGVALKDGQTFDVGELHVEAFLVPGHTPGSAVYFARGSCSLATVRARRSRVR
jgi:glyoxylase-like metal-dependent hydrolase (beta-lactamase superfamily II)